jgi:hypothetical protein
VLTHFCLFVSRIKIGYKTCVYCLSSVSVWNAFHSVKHLVSYCLEAWRNSYRAPYKVSAILTGIRMCQKWYYRFSTSHFIKIFQRISSSFKATCRGTDEKILIFIPLCCLKIVYKNITFYWHTTQISNLVSQSEERTQVEVTAEQNIWTFELRSNKGQIA